MKIFSGIVFISLLYVSSLVAQEKINVEVSTKEMSEGAQTAFTVFVPESNQKVVLKEWKKFINERSFFEFATKGTSQTFEKVALGISNLFANEKKEYSKKSLKVERQGNEFIVHNVLHESISNQHVDVIAQLSSVENGVYLSSYFKYADSVFISESNVTESTYNNIKEYVRQFGVEAYRVVVMDQVTLEEKELKKQEGILKDSKRDNKQENKAIGKYESEIDQYKYDIKVLKRDVVGIEERLQEYKTSFRSAKKKSAEYDLIKDNIKTIEKERRRNLNDQKSAKNKIQKNEARIKEAKNNIEANDKFQEVQNEVIAKQVLRVGEFNTKYSNIK